MPADQTMEELDAELTRWREAKDNVAAGKSYSVDGIALERQDLPFIQTTINKIRRDMHDLEAIEAGGQAGVRRPVWS